MTKGRRKATLLALLPLAIAGCVTTQDVADALPSGTVMLFGTQPPSWPGWEKCAADGTFLRIDNANAGSAYGGKRYNKTSDTQKQTNDHNWTVFNRHVPPEATGTEHVHKFTVTIEPTEFAPPGVNVACLRKK